MDKRNWKKNNLNMAYIVEQNKLYIRIIENNSVYKNYIIAIY